jgi:hypothetical protein
MEPTGYDRNQTDTPQGKSQSDSNPGAAALVMNDGYDCHNPKTIEFVLCSIFECEELNGLELEIYNALVRSNIRFDSHTDIALAVREAIVGAMNSAGVMTSEALNLLRQTVAHLEESRANSMAYSSQGKENPNAVFWPNPTYEKSPRDIHDELPWGRTFKFIDRTTPIGSAGSCFAMEIAHKLQGEGFNYVVTEPHTTYNNTGMGYSDASAAWGIMFNIPSLRQLVEKAFNVKRLPKLLWQAGPSDYRDPFREDISFTSPADFDQRYESHLAACKAALTSCEVFIATFGLNEIWELKRDGSVFSRAPWGISPGLVRRRILTVEENLEQLQQMLDLWRIHNPALKLIVTVSPVPFHATFRGEEAHAVAANCHAKSVLRVAAEEFVARNKNVFLFPSFETVMYCTKNPWDADQRHVSREAVGNVMKLFKTMFLKEDAART